MPCLVLIFWLVYIFWLWFLIVAQELPSFFLWFLVFLPMLHLYIFSSAWYPLRIDTLFSFSDIRTNLLLVLVNHLFCSGIFIIIAGFFCFSPFHLWWKTNFETNTFLFYVAADIHVACIVWLTLFGSAIPCYYLLLLITKISFVSCFTCCCCVNFVYSAACCLWLVGLTCWD